MRESSRIYLQAVKSLKPVAVQSPISRTLKVAKTPPVLSKLDEPTAVPLALPSKLLNAAVSQL